MKRSWLALLAAALALPQIGIPRPKVSKNHVTVFVTKALDSSHPDSLQFTGQVKNAVTIGKVQIPAGSGAVVALVSNGFDDRPDWFVALLSITVDGQTIPIGSQIAVPGSHSPMLRLNSALQTLASQKRDAAELNDKRGGYESDRSSQASREPAPRAYIPPGEELVFLVTPKQIQSVHAVH